MGACLGEHNLSSLKHTRANSFHFERIKFRLLVNPILKKLFYYKIQTARNPSGCFVGHYQGACHTTHGTSNYATFLLRVIQWCILNSNASGPIRLYFL